MPPLKPAPDELLAGPLAACAKCHSTAFIDTPVHEGRSTRRDCANCGRTMGFPRWHNERQASSAEPDAIGVSDKTAPPAEFALESNPKPKRKAAPRKGKR